MKSVPQIRPVFFGIAAIILAIFGQRRLADELIFDAILFYGLAVICVLAAFHKFSLAQPIATHLKIKHKWVMALGILSILGAVGLGVYAILEFYNHIQQPSWLAWQLQIGTVLLFLVGAILLDASSAKEETDQNIGQDIKEIGASLTAFLLILIVLLAVFMRLYLFDTVPFGTWYDEAEAGLQAKRMLEDPAYRPLFVESINVTIHYISLIMLAFQWTEIDTQAIRLVSVLMGIGTAFGGYLVGRELFGRSMGLVMAFFMAVSRWNVNFSRIGMYNISTPFFTLLTIGFLLRGMRTGRYRYYVLSGTSLGLGLCFYPAFQLFVVAVGLFLLASVILERGFLRYHWHKVFLMIVVSAIIFSPLALFAYEDWDTYMSRTRTTSLFSDVSSEESLPALVENARKHLLMFHWSGDPNGRHNLPGEPMLDPYTAALMILGLAICFWRIRHPRALFLPIWLIISLLGGILSLGFEAPQSLRSIGTLPVVYILALLPLAAIWQAWRHGGGRYYPNFLAVPLFLLMLPILWNNYDLYFNKQVNNFGSWNQFSTPQTIAANVLNETTDDVESYVISFFHGHPTMRFLAPNETYNRLNTTDQLPLQWSQDRDVLLLMDSESSSIYQEAKRLYPNATFEEIGPPEGGAVSVYKAYLPQSETKSIQGLAGTYTQIVGNGFSGPKIQRRDSLLLFEWPNDAPVDAPFIGSWEGVLKADVYGPHTFFIESSDQAELYLDEILILKGEGSLSKQHVLAKGNHAIRLRTTVSAQESGAFSVAWQQPEHSESEILSSQSLYVAPVTSNGLLGQYYPNGDWTPPVAFTQIDPQFNLYFHILPLSRPYTVDWVGKIAIPHDGPYLFGLESIDESFLYINGEAVTSSPEPNQYQSQTIQLTKGLHDFRLRFADRTDHSHVKLYWQPPGYGHTDLPAAVLFPPQGSYDHIVIPSLEDIYGRQAPEIVENAPAPQERAEPALPGTVTVVASGLNQPKGLSIGLDGRIYVADFGNQRLIVFSPEGEIIGEVKKGLDDFKEPFDVDINPITEQIYLLDPAQPALNIFDADLNHLENIPAEPSLIDRARGLDIDEEERIWLARTPASSIVALDSSGQLVFDIPIGEGTQPVDVVVRNTANADVLTTDVGLYKLFRYIGHSGQRLGEWPIPVANSLAGPNLAINTDGNIYMTEPEEASVAMLNASGQRFGIWRLPLGPQGRIMKPVGIAVGPDGRIWVTDTEGGNLVVIDPAQN